MLRYQSQLFKTVQTWAEKTVAIEAYPVGNTFLISHIISRMPQEELIVPFANPETTSQQVVVHNRVNIYWLIFSPTDL